jgi:hypothetical protein
MPAAIPPDIQKRLYAETDARFAVQTGVTRKLDPKNKIDQALVPVWQRIYQTVLGEYRSRGGVMWSIDHPVVVAAISNAHAHAQTAADSLAKSVASAGAGDKAATAGHAQVVGATLTAGAATLQHAAPHVPTSAPPGLVAQAAHRLEQEVGPLIAAGEVTPDDAVTVMQAKAAPAHAQAAADAAPTSPALVAPAAPSSPTTGASGGPLPWKPLLAVSGAFGVVVALASKNSSAGRTYRMRRVR